MSINQADSNANAVFRWIWWVHTHQMSPLGTAIWPSVIPARPSLIVKSCSGPWSCISLLNCYRKCGLWTLKEWLSRSSLEKVLGEREKFRGSFWWAGHEHVHQRYWGTTPRRARNIRKAVLDLIYSKELKPMKTRGPTRLTTSVCGVDVGNNWRILGSWRSISTQAKEQVFA